MTHLQGPDGERVFSYYRRLQRVRRYVNENLAHKISLADAARVAGLERKYFSVFFKAKVGIGFRAWLASQRIARSEELLRSANRSVTEVAFSVGYRDLRTFERNFKRIHAETPREYKQRVRPC